MPASPPENLIAISQHARRRMCQRNIQKEELELVLLHGENVRDVGDGCLEVSIIFGGLLRRFGAVRFGIRAFRERRNAVSCSHDARNAG
jgi:hypothetical protein